MNKLRRVVKNLAGKWEKKLVPVNRILINGKQILKNFDEVAAQSGGKEIWPVLKSNAYGHGLEQVAKILKIRKITYYVVDSYLEVLKIWEISPQKVLLIGPMLPVNYSKLDWDKVTLMVQSPDQVEELVKLGKTIKIHLKVNTGMNRQGVELEEIGKILETIKGSRVELEGVMSHLAEAENGVWTRKQENNFKKAIEIIKAAGIKPKYFHLEATAGVGRVGLPELNVVRLGIGLYRRSLRLVSTIVKVRRVKKGERISYGGEYKFLVDSWVGVVPVGYYEGLDRRLSGGLVKYKYKYYPIIGRICMNMCLVNFGNLKPKEYDEIEVIGEEGENSVEKMAKRMKTIPYEVLVKINESIRREVR